MEVLKVQDAERRDVGAESVGDDAGGLDGLVAQESAEQDCQVMRRRSETTLPFPNLGAGRL